MDDLPVRAPIVGLLLTLIGWGAGLRLASAEERAGSGPSPGERASEAEVDAFLKEWGRKSLEIKSLSIRFRQEKKLRILRKPRVSQGDLVYSQRKLSVLVRGAGGEAESEILFKDGKLQILYPRLKRLEVIEVGAGAIVPGPGAGQGPPIPFFAGDPSELRKDYKMTLARTTAGEEGAGAAKETLTLIPKDDKGPLKKLEMVFVNFEVREYRQFESSGDELRVEVLSVKLNEPVPEERFDLKVPAGTVVVHPAGKK